MNKIILLAGPLFFFNLPVSLHPSRVKSIFVQYYEVKNVIKQCVFF